MQNIISKSILINKIVQNAKDYVGISINHSARTGEDLWWIGQTFHTHQENSNQKKFERTDTQKIIDTKFEFEINHTFTHIYKGFCLTKFNQIYSIEI